jgi:hypothetical protein
VHRETRSETFLWFGVDQDAVHIICAEAGREVDEASHSGVMLAGQ